MAPASAAAPRVEQRTLEQWFFRITEYADRLLAHLDDKAKMDWSETTATAQRNWIGRSEGAEIDFRARARPVDPGLHHPSRHHLRRHLHGAGAGAPAGGRRSPARAQRDAVEAYRRQVAAKDIVSRKVGEREKTGVFTGAYAHNPATGRADPGLDRRLRADGVRHRGHHGGAGARRARLRVRQALRPADRAGAGAPGAGPPKRRSSRPRPGVGRLPAPGQLRRVQRPACSRGQDAPSSAGWRSADGARA